MVRFGSNRPGGIIWELPGCGIVPFCKVDCIGALGGFFGSLRRGRKVS